MTQDQPPEQGVESLQKSIEELELKRQTLEELKEYLGELDRDRGVEINIINLNNSNHIEVTIRCDSPNEPMVDVAQIDSFLYGEASNPDDIAYDTDTNEYKLRKKFKVNR